MPKNANVIKGAGGQSLRSPNRKPRWRVQSRREMREQGTYVVPRRRGWIWLVIPDALFVIPGWATLEAVRGLGRTPGRVWLWPGDGKKLVSQARRQGWRCTVTRTELRYCGACGRPLVSAEAERRRKLDESGPQGRQLPCGDSCESDAATRIWKRLTQPL